MEITTEQAKEFKENYANNKGYESYDEMYYDLEKNNNIDKVENIIMQQFAQEMVNKAVNEYKELEEIKEPDYIHNSRSNFDSEF